MRYHTYGSGSPMQFPMDRAVGSDAPVSGRKNRSTAQSKLTCCYNVIEHDVDSHSTGRYAIHAVYYNELGRVVSYNVDPEQCSDESLAGLLLLAEMIRNACDSEILLKSQIDLEVSKQRRRGETRKRRQRLSVRNSD